MNKILDPENLPRANAVQPNAKPAIHATKQRTEKREILSLRRKETAEEALTQFGPDIEIYGFTKGQFSIIDLLTAVLNRTGPADIVLSTWTAAKADVSTVFDFLKTGKINTARWLVDLTFQRRTPELAQQIRKTFGPDAIRVAQNHAKFALIGNETWKIWICTSMNLNFNPRFENFLLRHDPDIYDFHLEVIDSLWKTQPRTMASEKPYEIQKHFLNDL